MSVWVYEKTCPMCREPEAVGGGVSIETTVSRDASSRRNRYVRSCSHCWAQRGSSPSSAGFSGMRGASGPECSAVVSPGAMPASFLVMSLRNIGGTVSVLRCLSEWRMRRWRKDQGLGSWVVGRSPSCPCKPGTPGGPQRQLESPDNLPLQAGNTHAAATSVGGSGESMVDTAETKPAAIGSNNFVRQ